MKTILVTGANRGLGLELAKQYLEAGNRVYATCRDVGAAAGLRSLADSFPETAVVCPLAVDDMDTVEALGTFLKAKQVEIDLLINNAGVGGDAFYGEPTVESMMMIYRVNTVGPLMVTRALYPCMKKGAGAIVVNMSSLLGSLEHKFILEKGGYGYSASKAALNMVTRQMALDYKADGVAAIALSPGWVRTDMGGEDAVLSPEEAMAGLTSKIETVTLEETGTFWHYDGTQLPW